MNEQRPMFKTKDGSLVAFHWDTARNEAASAAEGRPIYDKTLMATVFAAGDPKTEAIHEIERHFHDGRAPRVRQALRDRFADELAAWRRNDGGIEAAGTPLSQWPSMDASLVATLRELKIYTVESLAQLSDAGIQKLGMGGREWVRRAQAFLDTAKGNAPAEALIRENEALKAENTRLNAQVRDLSLQIDALQRHKEAA